VSIVKAIAQVHGGRVTAANRSTGGAAVTIELPRSSGEVAGRV
jgi:signal transduction histidine kinase